MAIKPSAATRAPRHMPELGREPKGSRVAQVIAGGELLYSSPANLQRRWRDMITTGFGIAFGIFLFIVVLIILVYGLTASAGAIVLLWAWVSKKAWWVKLIAVLVILQILGWILGILGVGI